MEFDFSRSIEAQVVHFGTESLTDRETGELVRYHTLEVLTSDDQGNKRAASFTCGTKVVPNGADLKGGMKIRLGITPRIKNRRIAPRITSIELLK